MASPGVTCVTASQISDFSKTWQLVRPKHIAAIVRTRGLCIVIIRFYSDLGGYRNSQTASMINCILLKG
jgi:hypothetical protein